MEEDMDIQVFLDKKKNWVTLEDKAKDLEPFLNKIVAKFQCEEKNNYWEVVTLEDKEIDLLKAIIDELQQDEDEVRDKMDDLMKAYDSMLKEIYKMPGCIDELVELLKSHPTIGSFETRMITQKWYKQYSNDTREKNSSTPLTEEEIKQREEFLTSKCVEIDKVKAKIKQLSPQIWNVKGLLQSAKISLSLALKFPNNKDGSSSS